MVQPPHLRVSLSAGLATMHKLHEFVMTIQLLPDQMAERDISCATSEMLSKPLCRRVPLSDNRENDRMNRHSVLHGASGDIIEAVNRLVHL
jgi:hypothetical protein